MKKILLYFLLFILLCFFIPVLFTTKRIINKTEEVINNNEEINKDEENINLEGKTKKYQYQKYGTVKLLHAKSEDIEELSIDEYLYGVVSAEMPANYEVEALKAQAIVARTYTIYQMINNAGKHGNSDICDDYKCCQAWISKEDRLNKWEEANKEEYWNKIVTAVDDTSGRIITYDKKIINAFFHSNSGGITESSVNIWGGVDYPYLKSVATSGEDGYQQYSSQVEMTKEELINKLKTKYNNIQIDSNDSNSIKIVEYTSSNRVKSIQFGNITIAGTEARTLLGLKSTNFSIDFQEDKIIFSVHGYGHGVGMSQTGADSMAKNGSSCEDIIKHFYTNVEILNVNDV